MNNVLNKIISFLCCFIIIIGLFIGSLFVKPVFALEYENIYSVNNNTFSVSSYSTVVSYGTNLGLDSFVNENVYYYARVPQTDTYSTYVGFYLDNGSKKAVALVAGLSSDSVMMFYSATDRYGGSGNGNATASYSSTYNIHYGIFSSSYYPSNVYYFDSLDSLISNFVNGDSFPSLYNNFNIPRGYLAYIEWNFIPDSLELSTTFPNNSDFWNSGYPFNTQWVEYYHGSSVITIPSVLSNGGIKIPWVKGGNTNIWGQSKEANATLSSITGSVDSPSFICNPVYQSGSNRLSSLFNSNELPPMNGSITIHDPNGSIKKIRLYSLTASYNSETDSIDNSLSYNTPSYSVDVNTDGAISYQPLNSTAPAVSSPVENGGTYVDASNYSTSDIISTINNAFSTLISRIEAIFHPAAGYFQSLLNSFNDFVHWLSNLWAWLPAPVVSLIEAVLYISISVGLIKLVLK